MAHALDSGRWLRRTRVALDACGKRANSASAGDPATSIRAFRAGSYSRVRLVQCAQLYGVVANVQSVEHEFGIQRVGIRRRSCRIRLWSKDDPYGAVG